jgi:thiosulfate dehydrogenase
MTSIYNFKIKSFAVGFGFLFMLANLIVLESCNSSNSEADQKIDTTSNFVADLFDDETAWKAPDISTIPKDDEGKFISYGRTLVIHTSKYLGPKGSISNSTNGMNCQNCHLEAGTRPFGNNLAVVSTTYPRFSPRSGNKISIADKVNECLTRSMNGSAIDTSSHEMKAFIAYIKWLGKDVKKGKHR